MRIHVFAILSGVALVTACSSKPDRIVNPMFKASAPTVVSEQQADASAQAAPAPAKEEVTWVSTTDVVANQKIEVKPAQGPVEVAASEPIVDVNASVPKAAVEAPKVQPEAAAGIEQTKTQPTQVAVSAPTTVPSAPVSIPAQVSTPAPTQAPVAKTDSKSFTKPVADQTNQVSKTAVASTGGPDFQYSSTGKIGALAVAEIMTGKREWSEGLKKLNPTIDPNEKRALKSGVIVVIPHKELAPQWAKLGFEFVDSRKADLKRSLEARYAALGKKQAVLKGGKSSWLAKLARETFGDRRLWFELYVLNYDRLPSKDRLKPGYEVVYYP